jgi:hypothetical protein
MLSELRRCLLDRLMSVHGGPLGEGVFEVIKDRKSV